MLITMRSKPNYFEVVLFVVFVVVVVVLVFVIVVVATFEVWLESG